MKERQHREIPKQANVSYQLQYRSCGRANCKRCKRGPSHGPYWYAYWRDGKRICSTYIGKIQPAHVRTGLQFAKDA